MRLEIPNPFKLLFPGASALPGSVEMEPVELQTVSTAQLRNSYAAGVEVRSILQSLAAEGRSPLDVVMNGNPFEHWQMYPWQGGILDQRGHSQYFYHAHPEYRGEHGHFHTFYYRNRDLAHLVAIGMDGKGRVNRLYTFNRWGPGDHYFPAKKLASFLPRFKIGPGNGLEPRLHAFVNGVLALFRPEIERLFEERDAVFERYRARNNGASPYEDRSLEITSGLPVRVDDWMERIAAELRRRGDWEEALTEAPVGAPTPRARPANDEGEGAAASPTDNLADNLAERPLEHLRQSYAAGLAVRKTAAAWQEQGRSALGVVMNGKELEPWAMYPWDGGVIDGKSRSQYFYHAHPQSPEHGHFHLFHSHRNQLVHLVAISLDNRGEPIELFTVNRWVTGDTYLPLQKLRGYLPRFRIDPESYDRELNDYLRNLLILYQREIGGLLEQREAVFAQYRTRHGGRSPYEDRDLEVTSSLEMRIEGQIERLEGELRRRGEM